MFKIGDKVMQPSGKVGTIIGINNNECLVWSMPQNYGTWYAVEHLRLA